MSTTPEALASADRSLRDRYWFLPVFLLYVGLVFWTAAHHEPWTDEAQAWLIARDTPMGEMLWDVLRYEGSPPLWHVLCAACASVGMPYTALPYVAATIACAGVFLFLRYAPTPRPITALIPFTFFLCYQYAVIARSYVLAPLVMFALALVWKRRHERPVTLCLLLIVLANLSAFGFLTAGSLLLVHFISLPNCWKDYTPAMKRWLVVGVGVYGIACLAIVAQLAPPPDVNFLEWVEERRPEEASKLAIAVGTPLEAVAINPFVAVFILAFSIILFVRKHVLLLYLLPTLVCVAFATRVHVALHHLGLFQLIWLFAIWVAFEEVREASPKERGIDNRLLLCSMIPFLAGSLVATAVTTASDIRFAYSGSRDAARYIAQRRDDIGSIVGLKVGNVAVSAYFDEPIFANMDNCHDSSFWFWSHRQNMSVPPNDQIDMVVLATHSQKASVFPWHDEGFRFYFDPKFRMRRFDGRYFFRNRVIDRNAVVVFERDPDADGAAPPDVKEIVASYEPLFKKYILPIEKRKRKQGKPLKEDETLRGMLALTHADMAKDLEKLMPDTADLQYRIALELQPTNDEIRADYEAFLAARDDSSLQLAVKSSERLAGPVHHSHD